MKGLFITGTDTGVGKTVLTAVLLMALRARGVDTVPMKAVQTGCLRRGNDLVAPDLEFVLLHAGMNPSQEERALMTPYSFETACSPHLAAEIAGTTIMLDKILCSYQQLGATHSLVLVEGAGGLLVPICNDHTMLDLIKALNIPVLLAARSGLGTINHTLLSLSALRQANQEVLGVVMIDSQPSEWNYMEKDNRETIKQRGGVSYVGHLPYIGNLGSEQIPKDRFESALASLNDIIKVIST